MPYSPVLFCIRASKSFPVWCQSGRTKSLLVIGVFPSKTIPLVQYGCHIHPPIHRAHTGCKPPPWEYLRVKVWLRRLVKKNGYFTVRLVVRFDPPTPLYGQLFVIFFRVLLTFYYDYMCSETDFTQKKVNFHATTGIPNSSSYCCSSHSGWIKILCNWRTHHCERDPKWKIKDGSYLQRSLTTWRSPEFKKR